MIDIENIEVTGWEAAIRGMRNPMNSWDKSDSRIEYIEDGVGIANDFLIGDEDIKLMKKLSVAGNSHRKFMRMIVVTADITAPLYWWKEYDTYKVGTVANSCSTMHKIHEKEFTIDDFSCEHLDEIALYTLKYVINTLNFYRDWYVNYELGIEQLGVEAEHVKFLPRKDYWWQMIQLLPSSYNQRRTVMLNYEVLCGIYNTRRNHKLDEWVDFCKWIETLPLSELIAQNEVNTND